MLQLNRHAKAKGSCIQNVKSCRFHPKGPRSSGKILGWDSSYIPVLAECSHQVKSVDQNKLGSNRR